MAEDRMESESMISAEERSNKKHYVWICVFSLLIISIVTAGILYYFLSVKKEGGREEADVATVDATIGPEVNEHQDTMSPSAPEDLILPATKATTSQCSNDDFANIFSPTSFDERTRRCLQSSYDYKWNCSCSHNCSAFRKSIRKQCERSNGADKESCCKYSYCKKSIRCSR